MAKQMNYLDQLKPLEIFKLLEEAAKKYQGEYLEEVRVILPGSGIFRYAALEVPDTDSEIGKKDPNRQQVLKGIAERFLERTNRYPRNKPLEGEPRSLREDIGLLFFKSANEAGEPPAAVKKGEYLIVTRDNNVKKAEVLFKNLCFHATYTFDSGAESGTGAKRYLFHVKDDHKRFSSLQSLKNAGVFDQYQVLEGYESEGSVVFLPAENPPGAWKLKNFCRFIHAAPRLFGSGGMKKEHGLLWAITRWPMSLEEISDITGEPSEEIEFLYLGNLDFFRKDRHLERKVKHARLTYMDLKNSQESLDRLGQQIKEAKPYVGYQLELRPTRHLEKNKVEILRQQKEQIEYNLAYLDSILKPRPVLMRFTQDKLPALASVLRRYSMSVIHDGKIKYGFHVSEYEPWGYHFLLVNPRVVTTVGVDPLLRWWDPEVPHMRFWLDPFWARHYPKGNSLIFVPEGTALFPSMHDWGQERMDEYLRETLAQWFHGKLQANDIPEKPIYIFDGEPHPKADIQISILDQDNMKPLHTRLGWFNDNLTVIHRRPELENFIHDIADSLNREKLKSEVETKAEKADIAFGKAVLKASASIAGTIDEMSSVLTIEVEEVLKRINAVAKEIREIDKELINWKDVSAEMEDIKYQLKDEEEKMTGKKGKKGKIQKTKDKFRQIIEKIRTLLEDSETRRNNTSARVEGEIVKLERTHRSLQTRLTELKRSLRR